MLDVTSRASIRRRPSASRFRAASALEASWKRHIAGEGNGAQFRRPDFGSLVRFVALARQTAAAGRLLKIVVSPV